ncbi:MAG TPA: hypothetical protein VHY84_17035 [Bryobacteraceae bacterium]|jgi:hypothetical protein|nr:hypothetical protein [Bryobacteraceae bacterium]
MADQSPQTDTGSSSAARVSKAYFQLLSDLATAGSASYQIYADQITPDNIFAWNSNNGWIAAATKSLGSAGDLVPKALQRYVTALQ